MHGGCMHKSSHKECTKINQKIIQYKNEANKRFYFISIVSNSVFCSQTYTYDKFLHTALLVCDFDKIFHLKYDESEKDLIIQNANLIFLILQ